MPSDFTHPRLYAVMICNDFMILVTPRKEQVPLRFLPHVISESFSFLLSRLACSLGV